VLHPDNGRGHNQEKECQEKWNGAYEFEQSLAAKTLMSTHDHLPAIRLPGRGVCFCEQSVGNDGHYQNDDYTQANQQAQVFGEALPPRSFCNGQSGEIAASENEKRLHIHGSS
jgi:hypothetical protein